MANSPVRNCYPPKSLAAYHWRLLALLVDYLWWFGLIKLAQQWWLPPAWDIALFSADAKTNSWFSPWWLLLLWFCLAVRDLPRGRGLGKYLTGLAVVSASEPAQPPAMWQLVLRNLTLPLFPLEIFMSLKHRYGLRWGDQLANSVVVTASQSLKPFTRLWGMLTLLFAFSLLAYLVNGRTFQRSQAFKTAHTFARSQPLPPWQQPLIFSKKGQLKLTDQPQTTACVVLWARVPQKQSKSKKIKLAVFLRWHKQDWQPLNMQVLTKQSKPCSSKDQPS